MQILDRATTKATMPREVSDIKNVSNQIPLFLQKHCEVSRVMDEPPAKYSTVPPDLPAQRCFMYVPVAVSNSRTQKSQTRSQANVSLSAARIKRNKKTSQIKFKVRCQRLLYTLVLHDNEKADKLKKALPPSKSIPLLSIINPFSPSYPQETKISPYKFLQHKC